jgi:quercetin dioxygenase-like cupin family protein
VDQIEGGGWMFGPGDTRKDMPLGERVLLSAEDTGGAMSVLIGVVAGPEGPPLHSHDDEDELSFVVAGGTLTVQVGDEVRELEPGAGYWVLRGVPHTFANFSNMPATVVSVVGPGGMEHLLHAQGAYLASLTGPPDAGQIARIGAAHRATIAGPPLAAARTEQP